MKSRMLAVSLSYVGLLYSNPTFATQAQPVPIPEDSSTAPQLEISGVGIATLNYGKNSTQPNGSGGVNFSDSAMQIGAAQRLYDGAGIGSLGLGGLTLDQTNTGVGTSLFLHQGFLDYQSEKFEILFGRSDNPTAHLVDFPTLRGDDLITLTNPLDPFSNGGNVEEHRYSNVVSATFNQGLKFYENFHIQHLINTAGIGSVTSVNSFGATFEYLSSPPGLEAFARFTSWGFGFEHIMIDAQSPGGLHQIYGGGVMNLNESVTHRWDLRLQDIVSFGSALTEFQNIENTFQGDSNTVTASLRYLYSPFGRPGYQIALTGGYKNYFKVNQAKSAGYALTGVKRLGQGFDLVLQYQGQWRDTALASAQSPGVSYEQVGEVGLVFNFDTTFNQHISPRRTLLNQQHQYIPN